MLPPYRQKCRADACIRRAVTLYRVVKYMDTLYDIERYPKRKHPRLKGYDYSLENYYFITICTFEKKCLFGTVENRNIFGHYAAQGFEEIPFHYPDVKVDKYVVMPNHVHAVIYVQGEKSNLSRVVGSYKSYVTKKIHETCPDIKIWQPSFHDHIIRNEKSYQNIWLYIDGNPINWEKDCFYTK